MCMNKRRIFLLLVIIVVNIITVNASTPNAVPKAAGTNFKVDGLRYRVKADNTLEIVPYGEFENSDVASVDIPEKVTYHDYTYTVTSIGKEAFKSHFYKLESVTIPNSVTSIGAGAFSQCFWLTSVILPNGLTTIEEATFQACSRLKSITIPKSVTTIGSYAFEYCGFESIMIPKNITSIGLLAFGACTNLRSIVVEGGNPVYDSRNNCNAIIKSAHDELVVGCAGTVIPPNVKKIGNSAFYNSSLTSLTIPASVISIEIDAFNYCERLTSLIVEKGNPVFDSRDNCNAVIRTINNELVVGCNGTVIPETVTSIGEHAFLFCYDITEIAIPQSVKYIGEGAFQQCRYLTEIDIPSGVTSIEPYTFYGCQSLTSVILPESLTSIGTEAFGFVRRLKDLYCKAATPPTIPENLAYWLDPFENSVFYNCTLYVPDESIDAYKADKLWGQFKNIVGLSTTGVDKVTLTDCSKPRKTLVNGRLIISKKGKRYNLQGVEMK